MTHYFAAIPVPYNLVDEKLTAFSLHYDLPAHYKVIPHPNDLHVTLLFFGGLNRCQFELVKKEMADVASETDAFKAAIDGISFFGNPSGPRVVYLAVSNPPQLAGLYRELSKRLETVLQKPAAEDYTPHITIAKKKKDNVSVSITQERIEPLTFDISQIVLYSIDPSSSPKYSPECIFSLGQSPRIVE